MKPILLAAVLAIVAWLPLAWAAPIDTLRLPAEERRLAPKLAEAVAALKRGDNPQAATLARAFIKGNRSGPQPSDRGPKGRE